MQVNLEQIHIHTRLRELDQSKVAEIMESMQEIGQLQPIIIDSENNLLAGYHRYAAIKQLGWTTIECSISPHTNALHKELVEIDENLMRKDLHYLDRGKFLGRRKEIYELLYPETKNGVSQSSSPKSLQNLKNNNSSVKPESDLTVENHKDSFINDIAPKIGISKTKIKEEIQIARDLIPTAEPILKAQDTSKKDALELVRLSPTIQEKVVEHINNNPTKKIIQAIKEVKIEEKTEKIKEHAAASLPSSIKLLEGDFFKQINRIHDNCIDLMFVDPPYGILEENWEPQTLPILREFTEKWLIKVMPKMKKTGRVYICFSQWYEFELQKILEKHDYFGFIFHQKIIWNYKNNNKPSNRHEYRYSYEPIFYLYGPEAKELNFPPDTYGESQSNVWTIATPQSNFTEGKFHEAQKPEELLNRIITTGSQIGNIILDPFAGSGTTGVICQQLKRNCFLIEKDESFCKIIKGRINHAVAGTPI